MDNKRNTSLIRHIQKKYITHEDNQYNNRVVHSCNHYIVIVIRYIFFICHSGSFPIVQLSFNSCTNICFSLFLKRDQLTVKRDIPIIYVLFPKLSFQLLGK